MKYLSVLILPLLLISCSKNNSSGPPKSTDSTCLITSVKWLHSTDSFTTVLSYDNNGKLSNTNDGQGDTRIFTYSGNQIYATDQVSFFDTMNLNSFGQISVLTHNTSSYSYSISYIYTSDTVLQYAVKKTPRSSALGDTTTYQFTGGDLTTEISSGTTYHYTYYTDKAEQAADLALYNQISVNGALAYANKHLTKSISGDSFSAEFDYTFDTSGKIVSITDHYVNGQTSGTVMYSFTYACHL